MTKLIKKSLILKTYVFLGQFLKEMGKKSFKITFNIIINQIKCILSAPDNSESIWLRGDGMMRAS